jgi:hypothetical protein
MSLLARVFPAGTVTNPGPKWFEVNGLAKGTMPAEGKVIARGYHKPGHMSPDDRREQFLVELDNHLLYFRICTAGEDSGYNEFATGHIVDGNVVSLSEEKQQFFESMLNLCPETLSFG